MFTAQVITVSDRCAQGIREDASGPRIQAMLQAAGYHVVDVQIVPDEIDQLCQALQQAAASDVALIVTTGGTGFSPRDITPEATQAVCQRMVPGIGEAMRAASMKITPRGMLSRSTAGILERSLIVNLPGSPKAAQENLEAVLPSLDHGLKMLRGGTADCAAQPQ